MPLAMFSATPWEGGADQDLGALVATRLAQADYGGYYAIVFGKDSRSACLVVPAIRC
jgi:hypothetical protein